MRLAFLSHPGSVRANNEDAVHCDPETGLFIVADGIGGNEGGEIASATAVQTVVEKFASPSAVATRELLREAFYEANHMLRDVGKERNMKGMGTTLTAAKIEDDTIHLVHVGDSRAYLLNENSILQLTTDHTLANQLYIEGSITREEAAVHPQRHVLTRSIGQETLVEVEEKTIEWEKGCYLFLCSDGMHNLVSDSEIQEVVIKALDLELGLRHLLQTAIERGGYDNISAIIIAHDKS